MQIQWYGQSAFRLSAGEVTAFIDPFADMTGLSERGLRFDYPPIEGVEAQLVLVTHEHADHNGVQAIGGEPLVLRSTAGRLASPIGQVTAIASEHDSAAGTERGPNTIFVFELGGVRVAHFGDFGQSQLREEQASAIGRIDLLLLPVGGGPTIDGEQAGQITTRLSPRWVVPMHYRTERIDFLQGAGDFLARVGEPERLRSPRFELGELPACERTLAVLPAAP
jgi:L-ascorbate metabolism protein UlaG (beta-lactamase superfamily)